MFMPNPLKLLLKTVKAVHWGVQWSETSTGLTGVQFREYAFL